MTDFQRVVPKEYLSVVQSVDPMVHHSVAQKAVKRALLLVVQ